MNHKISSSRKLILIIGLLFANQVLAQEIQKVNWLTFEQLSDSLAIKPKKVFINFYSDWCTPCLKMDHVSYRNAVVIHKMNSEYYAVKMNVETNDTILFGGKTYINENKNRRNPTHQIPLLMASRKDEVFSLPAIVLLNDQFEATARYFQYLDSKQLLSIL